MSIIFVANEVSEINVTNADFFETIGLTPNDYSFVMDCDLNKLWQHLRLPNRPVTDSEPPSDLAQDTGVSDSSYDFSNILNVLKLTWSTGIHQGNDNFKLFGPSMKQVLVHLFNADGESPTPSSAGGLQLDDSKIYKWIQESSGSSFYDKVFTHTQVANILSQIVEYGAYHHDDSAGFTPGQIALTEGAQVGVSISLRTSSTNKLDMRLMLRQTEFPDVSQPDVDIEASRQAFRESKYLGTLAEKLEEAKLSLPADFTDIQSAFDTYRLNTQAEPSDWFTHMSDVILKGGVQFTTAGQPGYNWPNDAGVRSWFDATIDQSPVT